jgi:hypothetical protein
MMAYDLPTSLYIGEVEHPIRYNWRAVLDILAACADPELDDAEKALCVLQIFYPNWEEIPSDRLQEACKKACDFIDCGQKDDGKPKPKMIDWEQDAPIIIPEINKVAGKEVRLDPNIHWWTFFGWFMGIGDGLLASVLHIRKKKSLHKKLEKWEEEFYRANKALVDFAPKETPEKAEMTEYFNKWL